MPCALSHSVHDLERLVTEMALFGEFSEGSLEFSGQRSDGQALSHICRTGSDIDRPDPREASGRFPSQKRSGYVFHSARCDWRDLKTGGFRALAVTGFEEGPKGWGYSFGPLGRAKTAGQQRWGSFDQ